MALSVRALNLRIIFSQSGQDRCDSDEYTCVNGLCKPSSYVCDGYTDCVDGADEAVRTCGECNNVIIFTGPVTYSDWGSLKTT